MANMQKIDEVMAIIEKEIRKAGDEAKRGQAGSWNQNTYATLTPCGTSFCLAGHRANLDGQIMWRATGHEWGYAGWVRINGEPWKIDAWAKKVFELSDNDAWTLFDQYNGIEELRTMIEELREHGMLLRHYVWAR